MEYVQPLGEPAGAPYVDANPGVGIEGSAVPAAALEHTQREIVQAIVDAGLVPAGGDLKQLSAAILARVNAGKGVIRTASAAGNVGAVDDNGLILADASGGTFATTLPVVATVRNGFRTTLKKLDNSANPVSLAAAGLEDIDGAAAVNLVSRGDRVTVVGSQSSWHIVDVRATYESSLQTITSGGLLTLAHGLGRRPQTTSLLLENVTAAANWSVGDRLVIGRNMTADSNSGFPGFSSFFQVYFDDDTNIKVRFPATADLLVPNKTTGAVTNTLITPWNLIVRAER